MSRVAHIHQLNDRHKRVVVDMILEFPEDRQLYVSVLITDSDVSKTLPHIERRLQVELRSDGIHATHIDLDGATVVPIQSID
jgi:hypothetical protein